MKAYFESHARDLKSVSEAHAKTSFLIYCWEATVLKLTVGINTQCGGRAGQTRDGENPSLMWSLRKTKISSHTSQCCLLSWAPRTPPDLHAHGPGQNTSRECSQSRGNHTGIFCLRNRKRTLFIIFIIDSQKLKPKPCSGGDSKYGSRE